MSDDTGADRMNATEQPERNDSLSGILAEMDAVIRMELDTAPASLQYLCDRLAALTPAPEGGEDEYLRELLFARGDSDLLAAAPPVGRDARKVGDSQFEGWFSQYRQATGRKQMAREAYEAGMNDGAPVGRDAVACDECGGDGKVWDSPAGYGGCYIPCPECQPEEIPAAVVSDAMVERSLAAVRDFQQGEGTHVGKDVDAYRRRMHRAMLTAALTDKGAAS